MDTSSVSRSAGSRVGIEYVLPYGTSTTSLQQNIVNIHIIVQYVLNITSISLGPSVHHPESTLDLLLLKGQENYLTYHTFDTSHVAKKAEERKDGDFH